MFCLFVSPSFTVCEHFFFRGCEAPVVMQFIAWDVKWSIHTHTVHCAVLSFSLSLSFSVHMLHMLHQSKVAVLTNRVDVWYSVMSQCAYSFRCHLDEIWYSILVIGFRTRKHGYWRFFGNYFTKNTFTAVFLFVFGRIIERYRVLKIVYTFWILWTG